MSKSKQKTESSQTTNQTATTTPNAPDWLQQPWQGYMGQVNDLMGSGKPLVAGPSDLQQKAFDGAQNLTTSPNYDWASQLGMNAATAGANTAGPAAQATSRNFTDVDLQGYMNPYIDQVMGAYTTDFDANAGRVEAEQRRIAALNGGARNGGNYVKQALTQGELARARGAGVAGIQSDAFNAASGLATSDLNREASTNQFNAGQSNQMSQFNAGQQDNALARMLQGAGLLANVGQAQGADQRANTALQGDLGAQQRDIQNAQQQEEYARLAMLQQLMSGVPAGMFVGQTTTGNSQSNGTQTQTTNPGLMGVLGGLGGLGMGLGSMGWSPFGGSK